MMKNKYEAHVYKESETAVFWDMNRCPIPEGYDPCRVGPRIDSVLMSLGYSGHLTIIAIGDLEDTPPEVLGALSSTGILLRHSPCNLSIVLGDIFNWKAKNRPPATLMLISDDLGMEAYAYPLYSRQMEGYNILLAYPDTLPRQPLGLVPSAQWLWEPFLTDAVDSQETRRPENKCSPEYAFICRSCKGRFASQSFEMFIDHIKGEDHIATSLSRGPQKMAKPLKKPYKVVQAGHETRLPSIYYTYDGLWDCP